MITYSPDDWGQVTSAMTSAISLVWTLNGDWFEVCSMQQVDEIGLVSLHGPPSNSLDDIARYYRISHFRSLRHAFGTIFRSTSSHRLLFKSSKVVSRRIFFLFLYLLSLTLTFLFTHTHTHTHTSPVMTSAMCYSSFTVMDIMQLLIRRMLTNLPVLHIAIEIWRHMIFLCQSPQQVEFLSFIYT